MSIRFSDPFDALLGLQRALESSKYSDWFGATTTSRGAFPPINVFGKDDDFVVVAELPGADKKDLEIHVKRNQLRIAGKREVNYEQGTSVHRAERVSGSFDRTIAMPSELDADNVKAEYRDGVLAIYLRRAEREKPRSVQIT